MRKYATVILLGWQDSLIYRMNALVWIWYAILPASTLMLVWLAAYGSGGHSTMGGLNLHGMMTYYLCVTALSIVITPHPEWDMAQQIRDGKITQFIVRPIGYFGYRLAQETSYQVVKTIMTVPAFLLMAWCFRRYIQLPAPDATRLGLFLVASLLAYGLLSQIKFLLGISAFWIAETGGFLEIWNVLMGVFGGRLLPLSLLPRWLQSLGTALPFSSLYAFPMKVLLGTPATPDIVRGFAIQCLWLAAFCGLVHWTWRRGLLAYEAYGG